MLVSILYFVDYGSVEAEGVINADVWGQSFFGVIGPIFYDVVNFEIGS